MDNFIVDHTSRKGTSHINCEDNALSFYKDGLAYGIVSDGCSSEKDSHFISSFLCNYYRKRIYETYHRELILNKYMLESFAEEFKINNLFATMITTFYNKEFKNFTVSFIGDGTFFIKFKNQEVKWVRINQDNFPIYPEYSFSRFNSQHIIKNYSKSDLEVSGRFRVQDSVFLSDTEEYNYYFDEVNIKQKKILNFSQGEFIGQIDFSFNHDLLDDNNTIELFGFCSDGVDTFMNKENEAVDNDTILKELCNIKIKKENFLQRRVNIMEKKYKHFDDFSCVMFVRKD